MNHTIWVYITISVNFYTYEIYKNGLYCIVLILFVVQTYIKPDILSKYLSLLPMETMLHIPNEF